MKVVTTPMCEKIVRMAGISGFIVSRDPDSANADIAVVLSETETTTKSIKIKLNTFSQIEGSIDMLSKVFKTKPLDYKIKRISTGIRGNNQKIKVKAYSNFIKDIINDFGFTIVDENYDFIVYPDYMRIEVEHGIEDKKAIEMPSHNNAPKDPFKRAELRYSILEKELCMKP